jgi:hypothetical protein
LVTLKATIWAVTVVPMFAPRMTPTPWERDMRPELMKLTTSTVVTEDDWITVVTRAPVSSPAKRFTVSLASSRRRRSPATALSEAVI